MSLFIQHDRSADLSIKATEQLVEYLNRNNLIVNQYNKFLIIVCPK